MSDNLTETSTTRPSFFRNWISLSGLTIMVASIFAFVLLFVLDTFSHSSNPYVGILTYLIAPGFLMIGFFTFVIGAILWRRKATQTTGSTPIRIDLSKPRDRRLLIGFIAGSLVFLLFTAVGSYHSYHYTESVQFCGEACHGVMKPEMVTYQHSPHARVACAECHIGKGAGWYVRSKLSGTYQVYAVLAKKFPTPIPTPVKNLRPAQETCEECHWPKKFVGNVERTFNYFLTDKENSPYSIRMLLKVGGGDSTHGPVGGIHWHMNVGNKIEYIAVDDARQSIPWVRMTDPQGVVREFRDSKTTNDLSRFAVRRMDCMDCHNRPAHRYQSPENAVNLAISLGKLDRTLPYIKTNAISVLVQKYNDDAAATQGIATTLLNKYGDEPRVRTAIETVQKIYSDNFFPDMKANWRAYPDNIGHKDWLGCFRCHDGKHVTSDRTLSIKANDCDACHTIIAQGKGKELEQLSLGQKFKHPEEDYDPAYMCSDCHNGGL
ncbi:MAG: hypothetical protein JWO95_2473 [Verrucomicrobiales bacterium]|nr:hypothetical protein [Verrucomicrobiales bacterium]